MTSTLSVSLLPAANIIGNREKCRDENEEDLRRGKTANGNSSNRAMTMAMVWWRGEETKNSDDYG